MKLSLHWDRIKRFLLIILLPGMMVLLDSCHSGTSKVTPCLNQGEPWRLAYLEGGPYADYPVHLAALIQGLEELGWLTLPDTNQLSTATDCAAIWDYVSAHAESEYLRFLPDGFWSAQWNEEQRQGTQQEILNRLGTRSDIDVLLAMGTWAGQDLGIDAIQIPVIVMSTSDPIQAGIIQSAKDSGRDNLHAMCNPHRYIRQARTFHNIVQFKRLGLVYENTPTGRIYSNVDDLYSVAEECEFKIIERYIEDESVDPDQSAMELRRIYEELAPQVDAIWLSALRAENPRYMPYILEPLFNHRVATWAQLGESQVERGALLSIVERNSIEVGLFYARTLAAILNGASPRCLPQVFDEPRSMAINIETARRIGFQVPPGMLSVADKVYDRIEGLDETPIPNTGAELP